MLAPNLVAPPRPGNQIFDRRQLPEVDPSKQRHLEVIPRLCRGAHVAVGAGQQVERAQQVFARKTRSERFQSIAFTFARNFRIADPRGVNREHEQIPDDPHQLAHDSAQIVSEFDRTR